MKKLAGIAFALMLSSPALSATSFDFEGFTTGYYAGSLTVNDGPVGLTITPEGYPGGYLVVQDWFTTGLRTGVIGSKVNPTDVDKFVKMRFSFDVAIDSITFNFGDGGGDGDGDAIVTAYDGTNALLGSVSVAFPEFYNESKSLTAAFTGARSFVVSSGAGLWNENSLFWDISAYTVGGAVPEPTSWAMMIGGFAIAGAAMRRRPAAARLA